MAAFILLLPVLLFSVVAHEFAHAWVAYRQGDPTAYTLGRLTLNPIKHLDPFMSVLFPLALWYMTGGAFTFGAARPVPINDKNFTHYRRGDLLVSSAGIAMNLLLVVVCCVAFVGVGWIADVAPATHDTMQLLQRMAGMGIGLNFLLAFFNLMPVPPLDGARLFYHALPAAWGARYREWGKYLVVVLLITLMVPSLRVWLTVPVAFANEGALRLVKSWAIQ